MAAKVISGTSNGYSYNDLVLLSDGLGSRVNISLRYCKFRKYFPFELESMNLDYHYQDFHDINDGPYSFKYLVRPREMFSVKKTGGNLLYECLRNKDSVIDTVIDDLLPELRAVAPEHHFLVRCLLGRIRSLSVEGAQVDNPVELNLLVNYDLSENNP